MHRLYAIRWSVVLYLVMGAAVLAGCVNNPPVAERAVETPYPADAPYGDDLDVVAIRRGHAVQFVNREARSFGPGQLWLNGAYMLPVERIEIGVGERLALTDFRNGFGEHFPVGSFLRPERSQRLVLAELYDPAARTRYRLIVQPEEQPSMN